MAYHSSYRVVLGILCLVLLGCSRAAGPTAEPASKVLPAERLRRPLPEFTGRDWPWWRGLTRDGKAVAAAPTAWDTGRNVRWRAPVAGRGHSSPVVVDDRVYLTTADEKQELQALLAYDRESGRLLWTTEIHRGKFDPLHSKNSQASASVAFDGERIFAAFLNGGTVWATAVDGAGSIVWQKEAGKFQTEHGYASSPCLYQGLLIVAGDSAGESFLAALERETGELAWRIGRPRHSSFSSPVVAHLAGKDQLILSGGNQVASYDPLTGETFWTCAGTADTTAGTIAFADDHVFASGGYPQAETLCIRADGSGDISQSHVEWRNRVQIYVSSLLAHEGLVYGVTDNGVAHCWEAATGKEVWKQRLGGDFSASPVLAGKHWYIPNEAGTMFVVKAGREFELVSQNDLSPGGFASPVICDGEIFVRTIRELYRIGGPPESRP